MSLIQRFFLAIFPKKWSDDMRAESERWMIRCLTCGKSRSVWDAGGIRWKAASVGKRTRIKCSQCEAYRDAAVEYVAESVPAAKS
jgi:hypothetical protein